jgi:small-conductance mechanosensitive channel
MPIARLGHEVLRVTLLALIGFALLRVLAERFNVPGLRAALGAGGVAQ